MNFFHTKDQRKRKIKIRKLIITSLLIAVPCKTFLISSFYLMKIPAKRLAE
jgi:hypothetical protein